MIVCPNCNHQNPEGAVQCEACYTPLPALTNCPNCNASVQADASFCGQCGFDLRTINKANVPTYEETVVPDSETLTSGDSGQVTGDSDQVTIDIPDLVPPDPLVKPETIPGSAQGSSPGHSSSMPTTEPLESPSHEPVASASTEQTNSMSARAAAPDAYPQATKIQSAHVKLFHVQTNTAIEIPPQLTLIHLGKPNDRVPPTVDVSGFPNSEIVSRVHADIRVEGNIYYIEDVGSSNGTYVNNLPLAPGNRHRLRSGDRIALGKGDKVTFIFQFA